MLNKIFKNIYYRLGWKTNRKIIVFLSDDWGGIRVPSKVVREKLIKKGINMDSNRFNRFDALETNSDLEKLFNVLTSHKDANGQHPVITAMTNVANPDFDKIRKNDFQEYVYEPFTKSLERTKDSDKVFSYYLKGIEEGIFVPQFHGREHVNIERWMAALQEKHTLTLEAFESGFFSLDPKNCYNGVGYGASYDFLEKNEIPKQKEAIQSGLELFNRLFGYYSISFAAPSLIYHPSINSTLNNLGVKLIDVPKIQTIPTGNGRHRSAINWMGKKTKLDQFIYQRNAVFETNSGVYDPIGSCLKEIEVAFKYMQPAIISNHRASFVGGMELKNRDNGLNLLDRLIASILYKWPDVEFMTIQNLYHYFSLSKN